MAVYPAKLKLHYRVSNRWLEDRTLAGEIVSADHAYTVDLDRLDDDHRRIAVELLKRINSDVAWDASPAFEIIGSALDPSASIGDGAKKRHMTDAVVRGIGTYPVLPEPVGSPESLLEAWQSYTERYIERSKPALKEWIDEFFYDEVPPDENGVLPNGANTSWWWQNVVVVPDSTGMSQSFAVVGRRNLDAFHVARGAQQLWDHARKLAGNEHFRFACRLANVPLTFEMDADPMEVAHAYLEKAQRIADLALARAWTAQRQQDGFELEMVRWSQQLGSERLKLGIDDGYRMMPVYLNERLGREAPGFYAHLPKDFEKPWQPRTGPSEEALRLRRAVEERLRTASPYMGPPPKVEIGWVKDPPLKMLDERFAYEEDDWGDRGARKSVPFEAIVVPDYLGRYVLIAGVWTDKEHQPPDFLLNKYILDSRDYGLGDLSYPPGGESVAHNKVLPSFEAPDDDIPF